MTTFSKIAHLYLSSHPNIENITTPTPPGTKELLLEPPAGRSISTQNKALSNRTSFNGDSPPVTTQNNAILEQLPSFSNNSNQQTNRGISLDTPSTTISKACVIVGIWTYPTQWGLNDLYGWFDKAFWDIGNTSTAYGNYDETIELFQNQATYANIWNAINYATSNYHTVDVYFVGHGGYDEWYVYGQMVQVAYYCDWDGYNNLVYNILDVDFHSGSYACPGDISSLRLTFLADCYGGHFTSYVLNPGGAIQQPRACIGGYDETNDAWETYYVQKWDTYWYEYGMTSSYSAAAALAYAGPAPSGCGVYTYTDNGYQLWSSNYYDSATVTYGPLNANGQVYSGENLQGLPDGQYAQMLAQNQGDSGYIWASMNTQATGHIYIYGYSLIYTSHLYLFVLNGNTWQQVSNVMVSPGPAHYIDFGCYSGSFEDFIVVGINDGQSVIANLDAISVVSQLDPYVTVFAYDNSQNVALPGIPVYINNNYAGVTGNTFSLLAGYTYTIQVGGSCFSYFDFGSSTDYNNPTMVTLDDSDLVITAHYYSTPSFSVTMQTVDDGTSWAVPTNVYLDGNYVGSIQWDPISFSVPYGTHSLAVDDPIPIPGYYDMYWFFQYFDIGGSSNPATITVTSDMTITAHYQNGYG